MAQTSDQVYNEVASLSGLIPATIKSHCSIYAVDNKAFSYGVIQKYVENSRGPGCSTKCKKIYKIERPSDVKFGEKDHRLLLWHGTKRGNISGILTNGFKKGTGGLYGGGIYFADRLAKSMSYSDGTYFLCDVKLGKKYKAQNTHSEYQQAPPGFDSVKGMGSQIPKWRDNRTYYGAIVPCGVTVQNSRFQSFNMTYNEYIVYNPNEIAIRFLIIME